MPHGRRCAEAHGVVEPQSRAALSREESGAVRRFADRPLAVCIEQVVAKDQYLTTVRHEAECNVGEVADVMVSGGVVAATVVLGWDRRQSSPWRSFRSPFSSVCRIGDERATKVSPGGGSTRRSAPLTKGTATVLVVQKPGALVGPMTQPKRELLDELLQRFGRVFAHGSCAGGSASFRHIAAQWLPDWRSGRLCGVPILPGRSFPSIWKVL